jgi:hypothetical protein
MTVFVWSRELFENLIGETYRCVTPLRAIANGAVAESLSGAPITIQITTAITIAARM